MHNFKLIMILYVASMYKQPAQLIGVLPYIIDLVMLLYKTGWFQYMGHYLLVVVWITSLQIKALLTS